MGHPFESYHRSGALVLAAVVLAAGIVTGASAQDIIIGNRGSTLTGHVEIDGGGGPAERLEVTIALVSGMGARKVFTEPGGYFFARGLYPGTYTASVDPPLRMGLEPGSSEFQIPTGSAGANYTVTIFVKRTAKKGGSVLASGGRLISAHETDKSIPKDARKLYRKGVDAMTGDREVEAVGHFTKALAIAPDYLFALNDVGVLYTRLGRYDDAIGVLKRAIAIAPKSFPPHLNLAIAYFGKSDFAVAGDETAAALAIDPTSSDGLYLSGVLLKRRGDANEAISAFQRSYEEGGVDAIYAQFELGLLYDDAGQKTAAANAFKLFLQFVSSGPQADHARRRLEVFARG